jgi:hypothetical protein
VDRLLSAALAPWRKPNAVHDPAKVVCDLAVTLGLGGDCLADIALVRAEPDVYGPVASDPTVSRTIDTLAMDAPRVLAAIDAARASARARAWRLAGHTAPDHQASAERAAQPGIAQRPVTAPTTIRTPGPNRRPPERPRATCHTPQQNRRSRPDHNAGTIVVSRHTKDPG